LSFDKGTIPIRWVYKLQVKHLISVFYQFKDFSVHCEAPDFLLGGDVLRPALFQPGIQTGDVGENGCVERASVEVGTVEFGM
jgi:hypothetical protein